MASPARPAATSVSGAFGLPPDARCSYDQPRRREVPALCALLPSRSLGFEFPSFTRRLTDRLFWWWGCGVPRRAGLAGREDGADVRGRLRAAAAASGRLLPKGSRDGGRGGVHAEAGRRAAALARRHRGQAFAARALLLQAREVHRGTAQRRHGLPQREHHQLQMHRQEPRTGASARAFSVHLGSRCAPPGFWSTTGVLVFW
uniref:Uncharacterized protein n=1 Tax=Zea mays TaxID=4577 RepID=B4FHS6_MAIZE|nr:unknown [Zea mays]